MCPFFDRVSISPASHSRISAYQMLRFCEGKEVVCCADLCWAMRLSLRRTRGGSRCGGGAGRAAVVQSSMASVCVHVCKDTTGVYLHACILGVHACAGVHVDIVSQVRR